MDWTGGYSAGWDVFTVDQETWADSGIVPNVMSVGISRDGTDSVPLLETGTMETDSAGPFDWSWCRIYMVASQNGSEREAMATLLFERGSTHTEAQSPTCSLTGYSVLKPAADRKLARGMFAAAGIDGAAYAARLLRECTPAPVIVEGSFTLVDDLVFDLGASYLDAAWQLVNAAGWCMQIDGYGRVYIRQKPDEPELELDRAHASLLIPGVDMTLDISDVPNRYIAVEDRQTAVAENDDPARIASHASRGRWVDFVDASPVRVDGEPLQRYAERKLSEKSIVLRSFKYSREYWPGVVPFSVVRGTLPDHGIEGTLRVLKQRLSCGEGVTIDEESAEEVLA